MSSLIQHLTNVQRIQRGSGAYFAGSLGSQGPRIYAAALNTIGNLGAAIAATNLLRDIPLDYLFVVGLAGGMRTSDQQIGDVVVSSEIIYYEPAKVISDRLVPRYRVLGVTPKWITALAQDLFLGLRRDARRNFTVRIGAIASGEKIVHRSTHLEDVLGNIGNVLAVEMEGAGVAEAVSQSAQNVPLVIVRAIADMIDDTKDRKIDRESLAESAVAVATELAAVLSARKQQHGNL